MMFSFMIIENIILRADVAALQHCLGNASSA